MTLRRITGYLTSADFLIIAFYVLLTLVNIAFCVRIPHWQSMVLINIVVIGAIILLAWARRTTGNKVLGIVHDWYVAPTVFFTFKELYFMIKPIHLGQDCDDLLIAADRWLFGVDPTHWLLQVATPWLTEILQIAYTLFYFLFILLGLELYRPKTIGLFHFFMFTCVYGFFLSYVGYFFLPGIGPRFTMHSFSALDADLPGLFLTPSLRWFVNFGESVPMGVPDAVSAAAAQRDVFPSGHTMMTLVLMYMSIRYKLRARWFVVVVGSLLIVATVYQRYHYVVDLAGGAAFMIICVTTAPRLYAAIHRLVSTRDDG